MTRGKGACLLALCFLHGKFGCASRPDFTQAQRLAREAKKGSQEGMISFRDLVSLQPPPKVPEPLAAARDQLKSRTTGIGLPDMCPGGHCQLDIGMGSDVSSVAVEKDDNVMRVTVLGSRRQDETEGASVPSDEFHPQFFLDTSPESATWAYLFFPNADCQEGNLLFRAILETAEGDDDIASIDTVADEAGSIVQTIKTYGEGSAVIKENIEGTTAVYEQDGTRPLHANVWRTSETSGCENLETGCDSYFGMPSGVVINDVTIEDFALLMDENEMPAGYCTRIREEPKKGGASSELVQVAGGEVLYRERSAQKFFFHVVALIALVVVPIVLSAVSVPTPAVVGTFQVIHSEAEKDRIDKLKRTPYTCSGPGAGLQCKGDIEDKDKNCKHQSGKGKVCETTAGWGGCSCNDYLYATHKNETLWDWQYRSSWEVEGSGCEHFWKNGKSCWRTQQGYGNNQWCNLWAKGGAGLSGDSAWDSKVDTIEFDYFETEAKYDFLEFVADGKKFAGSYNFLKMKAGQWIRWSSDYSITKKGWSFCIVSSAEQAWPDNSLEPSEHDDDQQAWPMHEDDQHGWPMHEDDQHGGQGN